MGLAVSERYEMLDGKRNGEAAESGFGVFCNSSCKDWLSWNDLVSSVWECIGVKSAMK